VIATLQSSRTVVVQDRSRLYRESLQQVLPSLVAVRSVEVVPDRESLLGACISGRVDAVVFEMVDVPWNMPELIVDLRRLLAQAVLVGTYPDRHAHLRPVAGVSMVCRTSSCRAVARALDGSPAEEANEAEEANRQPRHVSNDLTRRELQVLALISGGSTTVQIAHRLGLSAKTVESRMQTLYLKLNVQNRSSAIAMAMASGLLGISSHSPGVS
jgi:DNA-binding NarL/FixJ family response regulator